MAVVDTAFPRRSVFTLRVRVNYTLRFRVSSWSGHGLWGSTAGGGPGPGSRSASRTGTAGTPIWMTGTPNIPSSRSTAGVTGLRQPLGYLCISIAALGPQGGAPTPTARDRLPTPPPFRPTPVLAAAILRVEDDLPVPTQNKSKLLQLGVRQKVLLILLGVLLVALTASSWLILRDLEQRTLTGMQQRGADIARYVSQSMVYSVVGYDYHTAQLLLDEIGRSGEVVYARVIGSRGNVMAEIDRRERHRGDVLMFERDIVLDNHTIGKLVLGVTTERLARELAEQKASLIQGQVLIIFMIALVEFLALSFFIVRPITIMSRVLGEDLAQGGALPRDIPIRSRDELGDVARQFNRLRAALNDAHGRLQNKVESADEELRRQASEMAKMNEELSRLSVTDPLTGLHNRRYFESIAGMEIASALRYRAPASLMLIDLDFFKRVNDTYGHDVGDQALREVARVLRRQVRETDILCRLGGEEFVVYCKHSDRAGALALAQKLRDTFAAHEFNIEGHVIAMTVSVGIDTLLDEDGATSLEELYKRADISLYYSKRHGRNRVTHYANIGETDSRAAERATGGSDDPG